MNGNAWTKFHFAFQNCNSLQNQYGTRLCMKVNNPYSTYNAHLPTLQWNCGSQTFVGLVVRSWTMQKPKCQVDFFLNPLLRDFIFNYPNELLKTSPWNQLLISRQSFMRQTCKVFVPHSWQFSIRHSNLCEQKHIRVSQFRQIKVLFQNRFLG